MPSGTGGDRNAIRYRWIQKCHQVQVGYRNVIRYRWIQKCHQVQVEIEMSSRTGGERNAVRYRWRKMEVALQDNWIDK